MLDREIRAVCPTCTRLITGKVYKKDNKVFLDKTCPEHGVITDILSSNAAMFFDRMSLLDHLKPNPCGMEKCKQGIFKCKDHVARKSPLAFIEVTTRCNMRCPVCYADAEAKGRDVPLKDMRKIIDTIVEEDPRTHVILIGGEPTIHRDFFRILEMIKEKGLMKRTFIATNGITLADPDFCKKVQDAGIKKFFLAFDGTDREACKQIRGSYIAYDSLRKALKNIRANGKAWIILSITAVKDLNVEDIPRALEFAMDNNDIVKRVIISPEVYCGRIDKKDGLTESRLTGDCIEEYLRGALGIGVATVALSLFFALIKPFKNMGILDSESWVAAMPSPFCGNLGLIWKDPEGKYRSIIDFLIKDSVKNAYELGRKIIDFSNKITNPSKAAAYFYYLPRYFFLVFSYLDKKNLFRALGGFIKSGLSVKKFKKAFFPKRVELFYLLGTDKYNYIWDKMPYCLTHHYRVKLETEEVIKLPGCFVCSFREEIEG